MTGKVKDALRITLGVFLLGLGVVGLALPVLQGWLTIFAGLYVLFPEDTRTGHRIRQWVRRKRKELADDLDRRARKRRRRLQRPF